MENYKSLIPFIVLCFIFTVNTASGVEIRGKVLDDRYFPVPNIYITVTPGGNAKTDSRGEFRVDAEKTPYQLYVYDDANAIGVLYTNLSTQTPELFLFGLASSKYVNTDILKIEFPPVPRGKTAIIKFLSESIYWSSDVTVNPGETSKTISVDYPSYMNNINGRVIYLEKSNTSFNKYVERAITIAKNYYPQSVVFDSLANYENPGSSIVTIYPPAFAYDVKGFSVYVDFLALHRNSCIELNITEGDIISTKVLVPLKLSFGYRLRVTGKGFFKRGDGFYNLTYSYPGATLNISTETPMILEAPQDKFWGVSNNTRFAWDWGSGTGIYVAHFHAFAPVADLYIVTTERSVRSPLAYARNLMGGEEFSWEVMKYTTYMSVDDYVKPRTFANDVGYKAMIKSELRTFRTQP